MKLSGASTAAVVAIILAVGVALVFTSVTTQPVASASPITFPAPTTTTTLLQEEAYRAENPDIRAVTDSEYAAGIQRAREACDLAMDDWNQITKLLDKRDETRSPSHGRKLYRRDGHYYEFDYPIIHAPATGEMQWALTDPDGKMIHRVLFDCESHQPREIQIVTDAAKGDGLIVEFANARLYRLTELVNHNRHGLHAEWNDEGALINLWYATAERPFMLVPGVGGS